MLNQIVQGRIILFHSVCVYNLKKFNAYQKVWNNVLSLFYSVLCNLSLKCTKGYLTKY